MKVIQNFCKVYFLVSMLVYTFLPVAAQENNIQDAKAYIDQAGKFYDNENYTKSLKYYNKAEEISKALQNDSLLSQIYTLKGHIHIRDGKNNDALTFYSKALDIAQKNGYKEIEMNANSGLIVLLKRMNRLDKALEVAHRSLASIPDTKYYRKGGHASLFILTSEVYLDKEKYDSALYYIDKGLDISKELRYREAILDLYIKKGMVYYYQQEYKESLEHLFKAKDILSNHKINNKAFPMINTNYFIANCYYDQKLYDKAINTLVSSINNFEENDLFKPPAIRSHLLLANCYTEKRDYQKANLWNTKYLELNESYQKDKDQTIDRIHEKETDKLTKEIISLRDQQEREQKTTKRIYWFLLFSLVVLVIMGTLYIKKQQSNKITFNKLMQEISDLESVKHTTIHKKESPKEISIDNQKINDIIQGLQKLETQEYFLKSECNLRSMAKKLKTNATYLSQVINRYKAKNFTDYINELRIDYVLKKLKHDKKFRSFSIQSIATEIGYKSSYSLVKHFKAKTGINPSYYIKHIEKQNISEEINV